MVDWLIGYGDGSTFSSDDGPPEEAPRTNVQAIAVTHISCGAYILSEQDYYCWHDDQWVPHNLMGLYQYLAAPGKEKIVLFGYWIDRERYAAIRSALLKDSRLPKITASGPRQPEGV